MDPTEPLIIKLGRQLDGFVFQLDPRSRKWLEENFPGSGRPGRLFVGYDTKSDFDILNGDLLEQVAQLLTGLDKESLRRVGRVRLYDPAAHEFLRDVG
jgi:hypothetical protein